MNDVALIHLKHAVERHEDALTEDVKQIKSLKDDLRELFNLIGLLGVFVQRPVSGTAEEKAAVEFDTRLRAMLEKQGVARFEI